jgi:hypothetical protein
MLIVIPRWLPLQDIVFTWDQLVLFITRWTIQALESLWFTFYLLISRLDMLLQRRIYFCIFPIWIRVNTMTCGGSHLGFPIGIKNRERSFANFVFFMLIVIPRWLPLQDIVFTWDQLAFFITRWTIQVLESLWLCFSHLYFHFCLSRVMGLYPSFVKMDKVP